jgi:hypothetical protein
MVGRAGIHPTKNMKPETRPKPDQKIKQNPYPSINGLAGGQAVDRVGRFGRAGRVSRVYAHPYSQVPITYKLKNLQKTWDI